MTTENTRWLRGRSTEGGTRKGRVGWANQTGRVGGKEPGSYWGEGRPWARRKPGLFVWQPRASAAGPSEGDTRAEGADRKGLRGAGRPKDFGFDFHGK